jgi:type IV pilus assembly protein PilN
MARINLLPWREELRRERQRQFVISILMTLVLGVILVFFAGSLFDQWINHQEQRNQTLRKEIASLESRIQRIHQLEQTRERLLSRKRIIEDLQASRSLTVELMDKLAKSIPVGITLNSVRQQGMDLTLTGSSQSNARVSAYLQNLEASDLFLDPQLNVVQASRQPDNPVEPYDFTINVKLRPVTKESDEGYEEFMEEGGLTDAE